MNCRIISICFAMLILLAGIITSCSLEKRRYNSGYHIEWNRNSRIVGKQELSKQHGSELSSTSSIKDEVIIQEKINHDIKNNITATIVETEYISNKGSLKKLNRQVNTKSQIEVETVNDIVYSNTEHTKISAEIHPHAFTSLICGILAAGSLVTMFIMSFSPAALVGALLLAIIIFSLLAIKLAKSANSDMYYARNRYSGRGLASAGMVLGIVTLVALIGFIAVLGITVVFGAFV